MDDNTKKDNEKKNEDSGFIASLPGLFLFSGLIGVLSVSAFLIVSVVK